MDWVDFRVVELAMADSGARSHSLELSRLDQALSTRTVTMLNCPVQYVSNDLHVPVRVSTEAGSLFYKIFIYYAQITETHIIRVEVITERKRVMTLQPPRSRQTPFVCFPHFNHLVPSISCLILNRLVRPPFQVPLNLPVKRRYYSRYHEYCQDTEIGISRQPKAKSPQFLPEPVSPYGAIFSSRILAPLVKCLPQVPPYNDIPLFKLPGLHTKPDDYPDRI